MTVNIRGALMLAGVIRQFLLAVGENVSRQKIPGRGSTGHEASEISVNLLRDREASIRWNVGIFQDYVTRVVGCEFDQR